MSFTTIAYALFLPIVVGVYWRLDRRRQNVLLVAASYVFYGWWDARFLALLIVSTLVDFAVGRRLVSTGDDRRRRQLLLVSVVVNLGILGFFKYAGFFADSAAELLTSLGLNADVPTLSIILPVGVSFYTFQTLSYTIDIYRRRLEPTNSLVDFAVFVAFFPQLVAGPIERARRLLPQLTSDRERLSGADVQDALSLILVGLLKKVVLADTMARLIDPIWADPSSASGMTLLLASWAFAVQIYGDFSGYTDIARGSARLLGIELMENFRQPYLSRSVTEFWRRWHISLSTWLRDYLYIPLGGNRRGPRRTTINLLLTMLLGGLWHGAAWTFVAWGAVHGMALAMHRARTRHRPAPNDVLSARDLPSILVTFHFVTAAWVLFRAPSLQAAVDWVAGIAAWRPGPVDVDLAVLVAAAMLMTLALDVLARVERPLELVRLRRPVPQGAIYGLLLVPLIVFSGGEAVPFVYFQF